MYNVLCAIEQWQHNTKSEYAKIRKKVMDFEKLMKY